MIPCPNCQQPVEIQDKHLGTLFTCPFCNAVYFIDWNGQPELASHDAEEQPLNNLNDFSVPEASESAAYEGQSSLETDIAPEAPYDFNQPLDYSNQPLDQVPEETPSSLNPTDSADFSDVTEFANSNSNMNPLSYTVVVEGIDSSQLLIQLKEAMTDSRFAWNVAELLEQQNGGSLTLPGLSPAKASVLINRIKYLPLKISWRQDVLVNS
ncbi:MAG: hypothetical protein ACXVCP_13005 [Bdellovibrio sp.]